MKFIKEINCAVCGKQITEESSYTIVETRTSPFPGVVDSERIHYCGKCWGFLNMDMRVRELLVKKHEGIA